MLDAVLSMLVLAAAVLLIGAFILWRKRGPAKQIGLMVVLAIVMIANVLIWTVPDEGGLAPVEKAGSLSGQDRDGG